MLPPRSYVFTDYTMPSSDPLSISWALMGGAARTSDNSTVICFSTLASLAGSGTQQQGRRLLQLLQQGEVDMTGGE